MLHRAAVAERPDATVVRCALTVPEDAGRDVTLHFAGLMSLVADTRGSDEADRAWIADAFLLGERDRHTFTAPGRTLTELLDSVEAPEVDLLSLDLEASSRRRCAGSTSNAAGRAGCSSRRTTRRPAARSRRCSASATSRSSGSRSGTCSTAAPTCRRAKPLGRLAGMSSRSSSSSRLGDLSDRLSRLEGSRAGALAQRVYLATGRLAERAGIHVVRASYDSPIPRRHELDPELFTRESPMRGIDWDPERQTRFVEQELGPYLSEFRPGPDPQAPIGTFRLDNGTYESVDAELLYGIVRFAKPARYVELGSGYSTLVATEALARNAADGRAGELRCYDPYPSPHVQARPELAARVEQISAEQLPEAVVRELEAGDVLFVDTSHTVKLGGDVNRIVLDLLPLLAPGVIVHFHDVFLPRDYSQGHLDGGHFWTEQYLLQAFLSGNRDWEVLVGGNAVALHAPERLSEHVPSFRPGVVPGAFWIRRRG